MQINLSTQPVDRQKFKCLVLGFFSDEKPPRGMCGFVDWRLNGLISHEIKKGHISGDFQEKVMIPYPERIASDFLYLFGMGGIADISYNRIYDAAYEMASMVDKLKIRDFSFDLPGDGRSGLITASVLEAMLTGFFDCLATDVGKLTATNVCLVTSDDRLPEVSQGVEQFSKNVKHMGAMDFSAMELHFC